MEGGNGIETDWPEVIFIGWLILIGVVLVSAITMAFLYA